jgi:ABC-type hemin transport system substrate-binding protein
LAPVASTPALRNERVHFVDGKALFWFGTRTSAALAYLRAVLERTE